MYFFCILAFVLFSKADTHQCDSLVAIIKWEFAEWGAAGTFKSPCEKSVQCWGNYLYACISLLPLNTIRVLTTPLSVVLISIYFSRMSKEIRWIFLNWKYKPTMCTRKFVWNLLFISIYVCVHTRPNTIKLALYARGTTQCRTNKIHWQKFQKNLSRKYYKQRRIAIKATAVGWNSGD